MTFNFSSGRTRVFARIGTTGLRRQVLQQRGRRRVDAPRPWSRNIISGCNTNPRRSLRCGKGGSQPFRSESSPTNVVSSRRVDCSQAGRRRLRRRRRAPAAGTARARRPAAAATTTGTPRPPRPTPPVSAAPRHTHRTCSHDTSAHLHYLPFLSE